MYLYIYEPIMKSLKLKNFTAIVRHTSNVYIIKGNANIAFAFEKSKKILSFLAHWMDQIFKRAMYALFVDLSRRNTFESMVRIVN